MKEIQKDIDIFNDYIDDQIKDFIKEIIQPKIKELCDKYNLFFGSGMGTYFFEFNDKRLQKLCPHVFSYNTYDEYRRYKYTLEEDIKYYGEKEMGCSLKEAKEIESIIKDVYNIRSLLSMEVAGYTIGNLCKEYNI